MPQGAGHLTLAAIAKCLQAITWLVARGNQAHPAAFTKCPLHDHSAHHPRESGTGLASNFFQHMIPRGFDFFHYACIKCPFWVIIGKFSIIYTTVQEQNTMTKSFSQQQMEMILPVTVNTDSDVFIKYPVITKPKPRTVNIVHFILFGSLLYKYKRRYT